MIIQIRKSTAAGSLTMLIGGLVAAYSAISYRMGGFKAPDSGMFPTILGGVLLLSGALILLTEKSRETVRIKARPIVVFVQLIAAVLAFGWIAGAAGLVPAIVIMLLLTTIGQSRFNALEMTVTIALLVAMAIAIFYFGLGVPFILLKWPF